MQYLIHFLMAGLLTLTTLSAQADAHTVPAPAFINGGIGDEDAAKIVPYLEQYSLYLVFAEGKRGRYAMPVDVNIYTSKKKLVFSLNQAEPLLVVDLPKGRYIIEAFYKEAKRRQTVTLNNKRFKKVVMHWNNKVDDDLIVDDVVNDETTQ